MRFACEGNGGSGEFDLKQEPLKASSYALGTPTAIKLDGGNFGLYSVNLEKGKRYEFLADHPEWFLRVDLLDEDGQFLVSQSVNLDGVNIQYFVPTRSGVHRLWIRGQPGARRFKCEPNVAPKIDGKAR